MKIHLLYQYRMGYCAFLLAVCLLMTKSCTVPSVQYQLPVSSCWKFVQSPCSFEEILYYERVPDIFKEQVKSALLKYMDQAELESQLEFVNFRFYEECVELKDHGQRYIPYQMNFVRNFNSSVITSICFRLSFNIEQEYLGQWGLGDIGHDPRYKNYLTKATLDSILQFHNYTDYSGVDPGFNGREHELRFYKKEVLESGYKRHVSSATVNLHTGEFDSHEEWTQATSTNINLLPKYGTAEKTPAQLEQRRQFVDSMLQAGLTPRAASEELVKQASQYLNERKPKKAMPLFNQAYLLDSTNANVYWGFGRCSYGTDNRSTYWYDIGLALDSNNVNLLRAYAHYEWGQFQTFQDISQYGGLSESDSMSYVTNAENRFGNAEDYFLKVLALAPEHLKTMSNLADLYLDKVECENAKAYYKKSKKLRDNCSEKCFERQLVKKCGPI